MKTLEMNAKVLNEEELLAINGGWDWKWLDALQSTLSAYGKHNHSDNPIYKHVGNPYGVGGTPNDSGNLPY